MKIKLQNVRLSFPSIFKPEGFKGPDGKLSDPKYSATFIMDTVDNAKTIKALKAGISEIVKAEFAGNIKALASCGLRDGDEKTNDDGSFKDGFGPGTMFISASNKNRPQIVDFDPTIPLVAEDNKIYAGCYVDAIITLNAMNGKSWKPNPAWGKKIIASLKAIRFLRDGESFGEAKLDLEDEFGTVGDDGEDLLG